MSMIEKDLEHWFNKSSSLCGELEYVFAESYNCSQEDARKFFQNDTLNTLSEGECDADFIEAFFRDW